MIDALVLNADGSGLATLSDDGHGAVYFIGYGIGSPAAVNEPGWTTEKGVCVPESAPGIYTMTAQAGLEGSTTLGQRFRVSGWSGKFFRNRGWDGLEPSRWRRAPRRSSRSPGTATSRSPRESPLRSAQPIV